jgi:hypothetical protein
MRRLLPPVLSALAAGGVIVAIVIWHGRSSHSPSRQTMGKSAPAFLASVVRLLMADKYAAAWATLNPEHQAVAPRSVYVSCEMASPITEKLVSLKVLAVGKESIHLVPSDRKVTSVAVTFGAILKTGKTKTPAVLHLHAVRVGSSWTWILPPDRYALYKSGGCTGAPPDHP